MQSMKNNQGYTLIELIVAVGLFTIVMTLTSGVYLLMISLNQKAQGIATGIDNLNFALETMTRNIRTGTKYSCDPDPYTIIDCPGPDGGTSFTFNSTVSNASITYTIGNGAITANGVPLTDPSVNIETLKFYLNGSTVGDAVQPNVTITVSGTVQTGHEQSQTFYVETGATMRGTDI